MWFLGFRLSSLYNQYLRGSERPGSKFVLQDLGPTHRMNEWIYGNWSGWPDDSIQTSQTMLTRVKSRIPSVARRYQGKVNGFRVFNSEPSVFTPLSVVNSLLELSNMIYLDHIDPKLRRFSYLGVERVYIWPGSCGTMVQWRRLTFPSSICLPDSLSKDNLRGLTVTGGEYLLRWNDFRRTSSWGLIRSHSHRTLVPLQVFVQIFTIHSEVTHSNF